MQKFIKLYNEISQTLLDMRYISNHASLNLKKNFNFLILLFKKKLKNNTETKNKTGNSKTFHHKISQLSVL